VEIYHFTEQPYPAVWRDESGNYRNSLRVDLPNRHCDPEVAHDLYQRYLDEWVLCDELGLNIMVNEHHATSTCLTASASVILGALARQTKRAKLLCLGSQIGLRSDPVRVAEEMALIDVISGGRLEMGFVKGVPYEIAPTNANPVRLMDRFWEAHDLIVKAMSTTDGPFSWQGCHFQYRSVNIWPRPMQQPCPPIWIPAGSKYSVTKIAERGYVLALLSTGYDAGELFSHYERVRREAGLPLLGLDRFAYCAAVAVADNKAEAFRIAEQNLEYYRTISIVSEPYQNPAGYLHFTNNARFLATGSTFAYSIETKDGRRVPMMEASVQDFIDAGVLFAGTPADVCENIIDFADDIGGFGRLLITGQGGHMSHADTVNNLTLFAKEVMPQLREYRPSARAEEKRSRALRAAS
jgi:alkanesulfonate monooxygenase SsuD/methylene tetrahydromethanopterin reductase-like flavin-dependent oxidoreductase (luciferase family)